MIGLWEGDGCGHRIETARQVGDSSCAGAFGKAQLVRQIIERVGFAQVGGIAACFADPAATVRCVALASDGVDEVLGMGVVSGRIVTAPCGRRGFGWDSTFAPEDGDGRTYAEMEEAQKNAISHRRRAFEALRDAIG